MKNSAQPIGVAVVGTGYFGSGLIRRLVALPGFDPRVAVNRTVDRAVSAFVQAGIPREAIVVTEDGDAAQAALDAGSRVVASSPALAPTLRGIDVVVESTGDLLVGAEVAVKTIEARKHLVAANADVHGTVGPILKVYADRAGVVYSDIDGDEPGLLKSLHDKCVSMGLEVVLACNCKGVLKRYATPLTQADYAREYHLQPWLATAAADGTKLNLEMTVAANALGFKPAVTGMHGPAVPMEAILDELDRLGLLDGAPHVDYQLGGRGVFVVVRSHDPLLRSDFRYIKLGDGPHYLFHEPRVMIHYQAPMSISRAARLCEPTVAPVGKPVADTVAFAKRDLAAGQRIDGIGGFDTYGLIADADEAATDRLLPIGIAQYARLIRPVAKDAPLTYEHVEFVAENLALTLRREQDAVFRS